MTNPSPLCRRFEIHGPAVELECHVPDLEPQIDRLLGRFAAGPWPQRTVPIRGSIRQFDQAELLRHLSPAARPIHRPGDPIGIYAHDERFWIIDDRWGMVEINVLKGHWRSWVLPAPKLDTVRSAEMAVVWPMAQLLRGRGVHLLPAVSLERDGWGVLLICPFGLEPELLTLAGAGYRIIGQRWTAVREPAGELGRLVMLPMPGQVQRTLSPRLRRPGIGGEDWVNLSETEDPLGQGPAFCEAVAVIGAGRHGRAHLRQVAPGDSIHLLRRSWPIVGLHPTRRHGQLPQRLAETCRCCEVQLSREPRDLVALLESVRCGAVAPVEDCVTA